MGSINNIALLVLVVAVLVRAFVYWSMMECKSFEIPKQKGKVVIVTGSNSGTGYGTAQKLASRGATVVMACRNLAKCEEAKASMESSMAKDLKNKIVGSLRCMELDLMSFSSIRQFAEDFKGILQEGQKLDILVNNAGIMAVPYGLTKDGLESQMGTNHFGHFLLTGLLFPVLNRKGGRIVNHSSLMSACSHNDFPLDNLFKGKDFEELNTSDPLLAVQKKDDWLLYCNSKRANLWFTWELNRRMHSHGYREIHALSVHPGYTNTDLQRKSGKMPDGVADMFNGIFAMDLEHGSQPQTLAAVTEDPHVLGNDDDFTPSLFGPRFAGFGGPIYGPFVWNNPLVDGHSEKERPRRQAHLWQKSVEITGVFSEL